MDQNQCITIHVSHEEERITNVFRGKMYDTLASASGSMNEMSQNLMYVIMDFLYLPRTDGTPDATIKLSVVPEDGNVFLEFRDGKSSMVFHGKLFSGFVSFQGHCDICLSEIAQNLIAAYEECKSR